MNIKRRLTAIGLIFSLMVLIFGGGQNPKAVYAADTISHTHIWATKYDKTNHWEYCTVCGEKRNVTAHTFTDHWRLGYESCSSSNWSNRSCTCGYSYTYRKPHGTLEGPYSTVDNPWKNCGIRGYHFWRCPECRNWLKTETCKNSNGKVLNCTNPGTCATCGVVYTKDNHILKDGKCINCGIQFVTYSAPTYDYAADGTSVTVKFTVTPKDATVVQLKPAYYFAPNMITKQVWTVTKSGTKYVCTGIFTFNQKTNVKAKPYMDSVCTQINGIKCYSSGNILTVARDHTAPVISAVNQTDQKTSNGYATIKKLDISGTEDISEYVKLSIIDKATNKAVVNQAMVNVAGKKWTYSCTPPLEAGVEGRTYTVKTEDTVGNVSSKDFTIYKTDSSAPQVESPLSYTDWTNTAKTITLIITDYGSGSPQTSLDNQTSYKSCTKTSDGKYQITYTFNDNINRTKDHDLYLKDALGNAQKVVLTVGNIDKNKYTIAYNLNNGSIKGQKTSYTVVDSFTLPAPTRTGYTFTGWTGSNGKTAQKSVSIAKGTTGNKAYTANWTPADYTISYNANGGSLSGQKTSYNIETANFTLPTPTKTGYTFTGWTGSNGNTPQTSVTIKKGSTGNKSYKANWRANKLIVTYNQNGGIIDKNMSNYSQDINSFSQEWQYNHVNANGGTTEDPINFSSFGLNRTDGYIRRDGAEWNTKPDGTGRSYDQDKSYTMTEFAPELKKGDVSLVLYAQWKIAEYNITYDLNGGLINNQPTKYNVNTSTFTLPTPTRTGYTFNGWTGSNGKTPQKSVSIAKGTTGNKSYTANWTPTNYTIKYSLNGGSLSGQKTNYNVETAAFTLPTPTRDGYTFTGWTGTGLSSATKTVTVSKGSTGNRSYTANWSANGYTVTFNYNKPSTAAGTMSGNGTTSKGVTYAAAYGTLPQPSIPGWTFNGWYTAASGESGISATTTYTAVGNQTLYAHWTMNTYSISYNANGGSLSGQKTSYNVNTDSFTLPTPTKNGYTFTGWTGSNGTTAQKSVTIAKGSTGNKSYTSNWTPTNYSISYSLNGGSLSGQKTSYNIETANFTLPTPTRNGYTFTGWTGSNGTTANKSVSIAKGSTGNKSYTANWTPVNYTITYNANGGSISGQKTSYNIETADFTLPTPTRTGYTFTGWTGTGLSAATKSVTVSKGSTGNRSYTANWSINTYTISYTLNGGSLSGQPTSYNVESADFTLPTPSKSGYTFTGWTGTGLSGLTKTVTVSKGSTGNRSYTAHFEKTVIATFKYYNNQTATVTGKIIDSATFVAVKAPAASGTPSGYTFRGWSTSPAANASVNAAASASVTISGNVTYYASYSKSVTAAFYYCTLAVDNWTYVNGAQKCAAASATQYLGYAGAVANSNITIPSAVTASHGGASAQNYAGVSKDTNSASTITPTTAYTKYYAVYTEPLKFYYYNGTTDTSTSVTRRMLSNGSTYSNSLSASAPASAAYDGAAFAWWSCDSGVSGSSSLRKPLETGVNSLYAVYKKNVSISYNANGGSEAPAAQTGIKYYAKKESGSNITNPSITVTGSKPSRNGYSFSSWNTSANGSGTVYKAGTAYTISANVTLYAQWQYNPVSVKVPQILTGDHTGKSQFRIKCDDMKAGNIKVTVPNSFSYKQADKADVTATITAKCGNNIITPANKVCVYDITTKSGLSAGCWQGSFNIGLTLTKE